MTDKLVITGMGAVTPIGIGVDKYWENLIAGKCGIKKIPGWNLDIDIAATCDDFDPTDFMPKKLASSMSRFIQFAYAAAGEAISQSGLADDSDRVGTTVGTAMDGFDYITASQKKYMEDPHKRTDPRLLTKTLGNICACHVAMAHKFTGPSLTVNTACASGGDAIATAAMLIRSGACDSVVTMGAESPVDEILMLSLLETKALSPTGSRPFDVSRDGFVVGEGGGALVIEREETALARGAKILCELKGWGNTSDGYNVVAPMPEGIGEKKCVRNALKMAGLEPEDIGYVNAHGTSTTKGDEVEVLTVSEIFGKNVLVGSTKGATGHMMGAGGVTEVIACIKAVETGILPPTLGLTEPMSDAVRFVTETTKLDIDNAMSNAFGFGGQNSCIIVGR